MLGAGFTPAHCNFHVFKQPFATNDLYAPTMSNTVGAGLAPAPIKSNEIDSSISFDSIGAGASPAPTVFDIVGAYKSLVANGCLKIWKLQWTGVNPAPNMGKLWQRNYYEHIIRNEESYQNISAYIINNPAKWKDDKFYK